MSERQRNAKIQCLICRKRVTWSDNPHRPFCSERCKLIDLGEWAAGTYRISGSITEPESELESDSADFVEQDDIISKTIH